MARRVSSDRDRGDGVGVRALRARSTARKQTEAAVPELNILRYVASLAAAAAHEINNPLTVVVGYVQLLADEVDAAERGHIDEMLKAISRIQEIITQITRITQIELTENVL